MTSEALSGWLALREPVDARSRSTAITDALVRAVDHLAVVRCLDLASGTGSNIRYLSPRLPSPQDWIAADRDPLLLAQAPPAVATRSIELGALEQVESMLLDRDLITASALLDLVSEQWIRRLADYCRAAGAAVLFAASYDGRSICHPREPEDDAVLELFNRHQRSSDKGFGTAAGPDAAGYAADAFTRAGYLVRRARSDWHLQPGEGALQRELIAGWAGAAIEVAPEQRSRIERWYARRISHIDAGSSWIVVGHEDLAGWIPRAGSGSMVRR